MERREKEGMKEVRKAKFVNVDRNNSDPQVVKSFASHVECHLSDYEEV